MFPGAEGALFLSPAPSMALLSIHHACQKELEGLASNMSPYYKTDKLVFHCTMNIGLEPGQLKDAPSEALKERLPFEGSVTEVGLVSFPQIEFIDTFLLKNN